MRATGLISTRSSGRPVAALFFVSSTLGLLGGCVGMGNKPPVVAPPPLGTSPPHEVSIRPVVPPRPKKATREVRVEDKEQHVEKNDAIDPKTLLGLDPSGVEKRLGTPTRMENGTLSRKWVYATPGCSFSVFFYPNVNSTSFRVLKYGSNKDSGEEIDGTDACVRKILTARNYAGN